MSQAHLFLPVGLTIFYAVIEQRRQHSIQFVGTKIIDFLGETAGAFMQGVTSCFESCTFIWTSHTVSYELMILCRDIYALLHVISLVDWPKHVKSFFFFLVLQDLCKSASSYEREYFD